MADTPSGDWPNGEHGPVGGPRSPGASGGDTPVVIPRTEYDHLLKVVEAAGDAADEAVFDAWDAAKARGEDLTMPRDQCAGIRVGESALRVIREYRRLTQSQLSEKAGVD